jgi:hypothetical protein
VRAVLNWERWHPCRRAETFKHKLTGKDAGAPGMAADSSPQCSMLESCPLWVTLCALCAVSQHAITPPTSSASRKKSQFSRILCRDFL